MPEDSDFFEDILGEENEGKGPPPEHLHFNGAALSVIDEPASYVVKVLTKCLGDTPVFEQDHLGYCARKHNEVRDLFMLRVGQLNQEIHDRVVAYSHCRKVNLTNNDELVYYTKQLMRELRVVYSYLDLVDGRHLLDRMDGEEMSEMFLEDDEDDGEPEG